MNGQDENTPGLGSILSAPVSSLMEIDMFEALITRYDPLIRRHMRSDMTVRDVAPAEKEAAFLVDLYQVFDVYRDVTMREVRAFGVMTDPFGPRYRWGNPSDNEAAVRCIEAQYPVSAGSVICYGPSNMTFWYSLERDMRPYRAQNHGLGGCVDADLIRYAPRLLYPYQPSAVIMQTGSNDIASGIPLDEILRRKREMYGTFLEHLPQTRLIVSSGLPLPGRTQYWDATVEINAMLRDLCAEDSRMAFMDVTDSMLTAHGEDRYRTSDGRYFNPSLYRIDKIQLNKAGHDLWTAHMKVALEACGIQPEATGGEPR